MVNQFTGKASSDTPALKPYRGKPAVRNFRGGNGNVGITRSPVRAIALPDNRHVVGEAFVPRLTYICYLAAGALTTVNHEGNAYRSNHARQPNPVRQLIQVIRSPARKNTTSITNI